MTDRELLRLHIEAVWGLSLPALDEAAHELALTRNFPPWSMYLGAFAQEEVTIWRPDAAPEQRPRLREQAHQAGIRWDASLRMRREVVFYYPRISPVQQTQARQHARILSTEDADLIEAFEAESAPYFLDPGHAPAVGVVVDGRLVSIAHSSRQTPAACELGINTLPEARRRGYARAATILWTALAQQQGLIPIYSAFAWNTASLHLARAAGYAPRIQGVYGPVPETDE
ncbi:MAG TPA: GNAT family N-acetyltransferase [Ktedonobacterales bacterium]|nr:GNAT family N-acetyltransferase [Ktedonobacterales bacterium]